jgi:hypothetical protein
MITRANYRAIRGGFGIYDEFNNLLTTQIDDTIPKNDPLITAKPDGSYDGVYDEASRKFIPDYEYDIETGWFWPGNELSWSAYLDNKKEEDKK